MNDRLKEINVRMADLKSETNSINVASEDSESKLNSIKEETESLINERNSIIEKEKADVAAAFENKTAIEIKENKKMNKRSQLALVLGARAKNRVLSEEEFRSLDKSNTTTAETFVQATAAVDGVNNAGVFIGTTSLLDLLREEKKLSPVASDIAWTSIKGLTRFPVRVSRDSAKSKAEGANGVLGQMEWTNLQGVIGNLQSAIQVTDEALALTEIDLGSYLATTLVQDLDEDWSADLIYGTGATNQVKGVTVGASEVTYTASDKILDKLVAAVSSLSGIYRKGAKIYVAQDIYDSIAFSKDKDDRYYLPLLNNLTGVSALGGLYVELDENLKAGDFIIGNVAKYYKANIIRGMSLEQDKDIISGNNLFVAKVMAATVPVPGAFIYGHKSK